MKAAILTEYECAIIDRIRTGGISIKGMVETSTGLPHTNECLQYLMENVRGDSYNEQRYIEQQERKKAEYKTEGWKEQPKYGKGKLKYITL